MNTEQKTVLRNIMYAVETGGQVYGGRNYADFTEAYGNIDDEVAITIGAGQWYADEARQLLIRIRNANPTLFSSLDTARVAEDMGFAWNTYKLSKESAKAQCIIKIIDTSVGHNVQDAYLDEQMAEFVKEAYNLGVTSVRAQAMCANFRHQGGYGAMKRIIAKTPQPYTLDNLYNACLTDTGDQVGTYKSRQKFVYDNLKKYMSEENPAIETVVQLVLSRVGKNTYTQDGNLRERVFDEPTGYSDCSSLMWKAFEKGAGTHIGTWTGDQMEHGTLVWHNPNDEDVFSVDMQRISGAQRGDLVFWGKNDSPGASTHVEMYLGNDQFIGHGSGIGPKIKTASAYTHSGKLVEVRRYLEGSVGPPDPPEKGLFITRFIPG